MVRLYKINGITKVSSNKINNSSRAAISKILGVSTISTLLTNIRSYYKLDETSGTTAEDSYSTNDGTSTNITVNQTGKINKAYSFNGSSSYITATGNTIAGNPAFSYSLWIKPSTNNSTLLAPTGNGGVGSNTPTTAFYPSLETGKIQIYLFDNKYIRTQNTITTDGNTWSHIVITKASGAPASTTKIYINGNNQTLDTSGGTSTPNYPSYNLVIGKQIVQGYYSGIMDEIGIWNKELTSDEVTELYNSGAGASHPF